MVGRVAVLEEQLRAAVAAEAAARRELRAALGAEAVAQWWRRHEGAPELLDATGTRWLIRERHLRGRLEDLHLVRPVPQVGLAGESDPLRRGRRLPSHHVQVLEETRRAARPAPRVTDRLRLAAGDDD